MSSFFLVFISNTLFTLPSFLLVIAYSHYGTLNDSALLGIAFAICAPVQLFFSMQHSVSILAGRLDYRHAVLGRLAMVGPFLLIGGIFSAYFSSLVFFLFFLARVADFLYEPFLYERFRVGPTFANVCEVGFRFLGIALIIVLFAYFGLGLSWCLLSVSLFGSVFIRVSRMPFGELKKWSSGLGFYSGIVPLVSSLLVNLPRYFLIDNEDAVIAFCSNMLTLVMGGSLLYVALNNFLFSRSAARGGLAVVKFLDRAVGLLVMGFLVCLVFYFVDFVSIAFVNIFLGDRYIAYHHFVFGFAVLYVVLYLHNALNFTFIFMGLERVYFLLLVVYLSSLFLGFIFLFDGTIGSLIWVANSVGLFFGLLFFLFLRVKLKGTI